MQVPGFIETWFWVIATGCLGAIIGSFVNAAAHRLPRNISMVTQARSFCPSCKHQLAWYDNIPLLSYLVLLGRCHYCRKPICIRYFLAELLVAGLYVFAAYQFFVLNHALIFFLGWQLNPREPIEIFTLQLFLIADLVLLSVVDLETWLIPIETTIYWIPVGLILAPIFPSLHPSATNWIAHSPRMNALIDSFEGLVLGAGVLWTVGFLTTVFSFFYYRLRGRKDRPKEGMGAGDCHLMGMIGAIMGWKPALATIFIGILFGCVMGISKILWGKFQEWRLGDRYKPWQPAYDLPDGGAPQVPTFWPLLVMGAVVLLCGSLLLHQSFATFDRQMQPTQEEQDPTRGPRGFGQTDEHNPIVILQQNVDLRSIPVYCMNFIGVLLIVAFGFNKYLAHIDMLPQGSIVETETGEKQEVLQGHYIPFGPSLAAAAILVVLYDPLIRNTAFWFAKGGLGMIPRAPYELVFDSTVRTCLSGMVHSFNAMMSKIVNN